MVVILALIALIATPIILNIINKSKKSAFTDTAYGIIDSAKLYYTESLLEGENPEDQTFLFEEGKPSGLSFKGTSPKGGILQVTSNGEITLSIHNGEWCATKEQTDSKVSLKKYVEGECVIQGTASDPVITLNGEKEVFLKVGETYQELGAIAKTVEGKELPYITEIRENGTLVEQIETSEVGSIYIITYTATNNNKTVSITRTVKIVDENGPVITFDHDTVELESEEVEDYNIFTGVIVTDSADGIIDQSKVKIEGTLESIPGTYEITYKVKDSSGNEAEKTRTFVVKDLTKPVITLEPNEQNKFVQEQTVKIKATDNIQIKEVSYVLIKDGVRGEKETGETVILNETGNYEIEVTAIDSSNNTNTITSSTYKIDRENPIMTFENTTIKVTEAGDYDLKTGVTVSDNSGLEPTLTYSGDLDAMIGEYKVTYTATDEAGNRVSKERTITVVEAEGPILNFSDIGSDTWRKATEVTLYVTDNNNLQSFTYEIIKDNVSKGVENVSVTGKNAEKSISLNETGIYMIKLNGSDIYGNTSTAISSTYKIDVTAPTLTLKTTDSANISEGDSIEVSSYYNTPIYSISGGSMSCSPTNTSELTVGTRTVSCTLTGGTGLTTAVDKTIIVSSECSKIVLGKEITSGIECKDPDKNPRYVGYNPNNYVKFNNELWRIIGVFNGQAKIIRNEFYSTSTSWDKDSSNGGHGDYGNNDWSKATLQKELNGTYLNSINATYKAMIDESHVWNLGGMPAKEYDSFYAADYYNYERGTTVYAGRPTTWIGGVGLMYASDYGYSTSLDGCDKLPVDNWYGRRPEGATNNQMLCYKYSWLYKSSPTQWTLTPSTLLEALVFTVHENAQKFYARVAYAASPVLYLKRDVKITSGTGTSADPYLLIQ